MARSKNTVATPAAPAVIASSHEVVSPRDVVLPVAEEAATPAFGDTLPAFVARTPWLRWLNALNGEQRVVLLLSSLAALIAIPWLGAVGFWDPWESQYGEVAREMITRGDFLNPWYEFSWFFSKPALDLWLMATGMLIAHTTGPERYIGIYTEWCVRFPFALISAIGAVTLFVAAGRLIARRAAIFGCVALLTAPLFVFLSRQAVPDPVVVGLITAGMACLAIVMFEHEFPEGYVPAIGESWSKRDGWLIAFYCFTGLATLSKGLFGFLIPGAVVFIYCLATGEWFRLRRLRLGMGVIIFLIITAPWYTHMFSFEGRDEEGKSFFERFIIHDHFRRLFAGVHTTTPGGTFIYFIEQLGFDCFPWVFAFPGAIAQMGRAHVRPKTRRERMELFLFLWVLVGFSLFAFSATKFHHYVFPAIPPLLLFCGIWLDRVLTDGLRRHAAELFAGGIFYGLVAHDLSMTPKHFTDMFVYNYDRPYPEKEVDPRGTFNLIFAAAPLVALSPWIFDRLAQAWALLRSFGSKTVRTELRASAKARWDGAPNPKPESAQDRTVFVAAVLGTALVFAIFLGWFHWRALSPHWTQRDLFYKYDELSTPDEPIAAYQMNWRGETLYSKNTVRQIARATDPMISLGDYLNGPGKRKWILVEQARLAGLRQAIGNQARLRVVENRNVKFVLTVAEPPAAGQSSTAAPPVSTPGQVSPGRPLDQSGGSPQSAPVSQPQNIGVPP